MRLGGCGDIVHRRGSKEALLSVCYLLPFMVRTTRITITANGVPERAPAGRKSLERCEDLNQWDSVRGQAKPKTSASPRR